MTIHRRNCCHQIPEIVTLNMHMKVAHVLLERKKSDAVFMVLHCSGHDGFDGHCSGHDGQFLF
jgi:hypothetical protein